MVSHGPGGRRYGACADRLETPLLLIFLLMVCLPVLADVKRSGRKEKSSLICLALVFVTNGIVSLAALYLLWQVDGNYFLLLYALSAILAVITAGKLKSGFLRGTICRMLVPFLLFNVTITAVSNWGGTLGLTPVKIFHKGYYDHMEESHELLVSYGNEKIWDVLAENPRTRVVVFGEQPEMLRFPCSTQSYTDIEGSGGNFQSVIQPGDTGRVLYIRGSGSYLSRKRILKARNGRIPKRDRAFKTGVSLRPPV